MASWTPAVPLLALSAAGSVQIAMVGDGGKPMVTGETGSTAGKARGGQARLIAMALVLFVGGVLASSFGPMLMRELGIASVAAQDGTPIAQPGNGCFTDSDGVQADLWMRSELYFGTTKDDGTPYTEADWDGFLADVVTPRFPDGLTVLTGIGQWRSGEGAEIGRETSKVLIILYPMDPTGETNTKLEEIRDLYEEQFNQQSVLRTDDSVGVCTSF